MSDNMVYSGNDELWILTFTTRTSVSHANSCDKATVSDVVILLPDDIKMQFGDAIPENLRHGLRQCYLKIRTCVRDILCLNEADVWVAQQNGGYYIVFRTKKLAEQVFQEGFVVQEAIEIANENTLRDLLRMNSLDAKGHKYVNFQLKMPD